MYRQAKGGCDRGQGAEAEIQGFPLLHPRDVALRNPGSFSQVAERKPLLLAQKRDAGLLQFDHIVIETTGLANPGPVAQTFFIDEEVSIHYMLDAVITVAIANWSPKPGRSAGTTADGFHFTMEILCLPAKAEAP